MEVRCLLPRPLIHCAVDTFDWRYVRSTQTLQNSRTCCKLNGRPNPKKYPFCTLRSTRSRWVGPFAPRFRTSAITLILHQRLRNEVASLRAALSTRNESPMGSDARQHNTAGAAAGAVIRHPQAAQPAQPLDLEATPAVAAAAAASFEMLMREQLLDAERRQHAGVRWVPFSALLCLLFLCACLT